MLSTDFWTGFVKHAAEEASKPHKVVTKEKTVTEEHPPGKKPAPAPAPAAGETQVDPAQVADQAGALDQEEQAAVVQEQPVQPEVDEALATGVGWSATDFDKGFWDQRWNSFYDRRPDLLAKQDPDIIAKYPHIIAKYPEVFEDTMMEHPPENPKVASNVAELAGLGLLAAPSAAALSGNKVKKSTEHKFELAGLGTLAAPSAISLAKTLVKGE